MSTWHKIGITDFDIVELALTSEDLQELGSISYGKRLGLIRLDHIERFANYLLGQEQENGHDTRSAEFRRIILSTAVVFTAPDGSEVVAFPRSVENSFNKQLSAFRDQDKRSSLELTIAISLALGEVDKNGQLAICAANAVDACALAADEFASFLQHPRRQNLFDLEDFFQGVVDSNVLASCLELIRRLLFAAGAALNTLSAATLGHYDFKDVADAVALWHVAEGADVRRLVADLEQCAARTPKMDIAAETIYEPEPNDTSWIERCSQSAQRVMRWIYTRYETTALKFAIRVGVAWPGPALYGYEDGEGEPHAAYMLCAALASTEPSSRPLLYGTHEVLVEFDGIIAIPSCFLEGACKIYAYVDPDDKDVLICRTEKRHFEYLAHLMHGEQDFDDYAWNLHAESDCLEETFADFEETFLACSAAIEFDVFDGNIALVDIADAIGLQRGAQAAIIGVDDHFEIMSTVKLDEPHKDIGLDDDSLSQIIFEE